MKLSIVTINYNNAEGLRKTLASVALQTYRDIEHIIIDAASTDGSVDVIKEYATSSASLHHSIIWRSEPDQGIYDGMNRGIRKATGDYIQILNSGDILAAPDVTERMMAEIVNIKSRISNNAPSILYGNMIRSNANGTYTCDGAGGTRKGIRTEKVEWTMYDFIRGTINHNPTYIRRDVYGKYGMYDDSLKIVSDWKWFVKAIVYGGEQVYYTPIDVTIFDTTGISETNLTAREAERRAELEKMLPAAILKDYDDYHFPIEQYNRLKKHHLWGLVWLMERVMFKVERLCYLNKV